MPQSGLSAFIIASRCRPDGQLLQLSGQQFELLVCAEFVQAVNADLNRLTGIGCDGAGAANRTWRARSYQREAGPRLAPLIHGIQQALEMDGQ